MLVLREEDPDLYDRIEEKNLVRQYDLMTNCIEIGLSQGRRVFDKYMLWDLNHVAVANISQFGGRFREEPIYVGTHKPPHFRDVPELMDQFKCPRELVQLDRHRTGGLWTVAAQLDSSIHRGERSNGQGGFVLSPMCPLWRLDRRAQNSS